jgi:predicted MFS family arabinose efflux permease
MAVYGRILKTPGVALLITATTLTRLPFAINGLAVILFLRETTGSFATAGLVAGTLALGAGIGAPLAARLVDRRSAVMLMPLAVGHAAAILLLWMLGELGAPTVALVASAIAAGITFPPSGSVLRSRWPELMNGDPELIRGAYAFDSVTIEISFVSGPLVTAALVALVAPQAALALSAVLVIAGTALFIWRLPDRRRASAAGEATTGLGPLRAPAIRLIALTTIPVGFLIGAVEVTIPAFSEEAGSAALAGLLLALWSAASGVGGLVFGARTSRRELLETYLLIGLLFPLACLPMIAASSPVAMALLVLLAGAPIAPLIATRNELIAAVAPAGTGTESFTWLMTSLIAGLSLGTAVGGAVIESSGWPATVLVGTTVAAVGAIVAFAGRGVLRPALAPA